MMILRRLCSGSMRLLPVRTNNERGRTFAPDLANAFFCGHGQACTTSPDTRERSGWWKRAEIRSRRLRYALRHLPPIFPGSTCLPVTPSGLSHPPSTKWFSSAVPPLSFAVSSRIQNKSEAARSSSCSSIFPPMTLWAGPGTRARGVHCRRFHAWTLPCRRRFGSKAARPALNNGRGLRLVPESD